MSFLEKSNGVISHKSKVKSSSNNEVDPTFEFVSTLDAIEFTRVKLFTLTFP